MRIPRLQVTSFVPQPIRRLLRIYRPVRYLVVDNIELLFGWRDVLTPPKRMMYGVGGEDSYTSYRKIGEASLRYLRQLGGLKPKDSFLEVGCGLGRTAAQLTKYLYKNSVYEGFDIVPVGIEWCRREIGRRYPNFHFQLADIYNLEYNPKGRYMPSSYRFPYKDESIDFVFLWSVFTHMLPQDMENYLSEIARVLRSGARCLASFFLLNAASIRLIESGLSTLAFRHQLGGYRTINPTVPERAVAYEEICVRSLFRRCGLSIIEPIHYGSWPRIFDPLDYQDLIVATRAER